MSGVVISVVDAAGEASLEVNAGEVTVDLETVFRAQYGRIARVIDRVIRDPPRAEDLAVEVSAIEGTGGLEKIKRKPPANI